MNFIKPSSKNGRGYRSLAYFIALCMILTFVPAASASYALSSDGSGGDPVAWDGTVDTSWYDVNDEEDEFIISTAAELAGLASIVNGTATPSGIAQDSFTNKTITLGADIDLGNHAWMPIGTAEWTSITYGAQDGLTSVTAESLPFDGIFDGAGKTISNLTINGGQSFAGLFSYAGINATIKDLTVFGTVDATGDCIAGLVGYNRGLISGCTNGIVVHANKDDSGIHMSTETHNAGGIAGFNDARDGLGIGRIVNSANLANITGWIAVGGIVGQNAGTIESCFNSGKVDGENAGSKNGVGGIAGRNGNNNTAAEMGIIKNCYSFGEVGRSGQKWVGGITGFQNALSYIQNSYFAGTLVRGNSYYNALVGNQETKSAENKNNYSIESAYNVSNSKTDNEAGIKKTEAEMKSADFVTLLNNSQDPAPWMTDSANRPTHNGYPVLADQKKANASATFVTFAAISLPTKLSYQTGQIFDLSGFAAVAKYDDNTQDAVPSSNVTANLASDHELTLDDTQVTINVTYGTHMGSFTYDLEVTQSALSALALKTAPTLTLYASGESFDPAGLVVTATYTSGKSADIPAPNANLTFSPQTLNAGITAVTAIYTENDVTKTVDIPVTVLDTPIPAVRDGIYQLANANDMLWFSARVNAGVLNDVDANLVNDINLSDVPFTPIGTNTQNYTGVFDGNGKTLTLNITGGTYRGVFGYIGSGGVVKNLTVSGSVSGTSYVGGIAGYAYGTIEDCVNKAAISGSAYLGGIAGYASSKTSAIRNCVNEGSVSGTTGNIGGVAGYANNAEISGVSNSGTVRGGAANVGGVVGTAAGGSVANVRNTGNVTNTANVAGGIIGAASGTLTVSNAVNSGTVTGTYNVGGVVGSYGSTGTSDTLVNTGTVSATNTTATVSYAVGGVVGTVTAAGTLQNSCNKGTVSGGVYNVGGVVGLLSAAGAITDSYNRGDITSTLTNARVGGVVGSVSNATGAVNNTYSTSSLTYGSTTTYGGAIGYAAGTTNISNNYYLTTAANKDGAGAITKTESELKALANDLGDAFAADSASNPRNGGYPILAWERGQTVSFDLNGGEGETPVDRTVYKGEAYGSLPEVTRKGYTFAGWYTDEADGDRITEETPVSITALQTLYAHWTANTYTVTYNVNGGNKLASPTKSVTYDSAYGGLANPTRTGYTFAGWYTAASGGARIMAATIVNITTPQTLYARWTVNTYTVTYNVNGGNELSETTKTVTYDSAYGTLAIPTREDYSFEGWYTEKAGGTEVTANTLFRGDANVVLYARWNKLGATDAGVVDGVTDKTEEGNVYDKYAEDKGFVLHIEGEFDPDVKVYIGLIRLTKNVDYTVSEGSTVVTILSAALDRFAASDKPYAVEVVFTKIYDKDGKQVNVAKVTQALYIKDSAPKPREEQLYESTPIDSNTGTAVFGGGSVARFTAKSGMAALSDTTGETNIAPTFGETDSLPSIEESPMPLTDNAVGDTAPEREDSGGISAGMLIALFIAAALIGGGAAIFLMRRRTQA